MQWLKDSDARCVVHNDRKKFKRLSRATLNWIDGVQNLIVYESSTQLIMGCEAEGGIDIQDQLVTDQANLSVPASDHEIEVVVPPEPSAPAEHPLNVSYTPEAAFETLEELGTGTHAVVFRGK